jgi:hypothetical protein
MAFAYYDRLNKTQKATYRKSDAIATVPLPDIEALRPLMETIRLALIADDRRQTSRAVVAFVAMILMQLKVPPVAAEVLDRRPSSDTSELHGLYTREEGVTPKLQVWMRTAANARPVAFRTFLRTLLHEVLHHLDFELFRLEDTFHTEGFYRRESSIVRQLLGEVVKAERKVTGKLAGQLELFPGAGKKR